MKRKNLYNKGQIIIINTILFLAISLFIVGGIAYPIASRYSNAQGLMSSKNAFAASDSAINEALYRYKNNKHGDLLSSVVIGSTTVPVSITNGVNSKMIVASTTIGGYQRAAKLNLALGTGAVFRYGVQSGQGGFLLQQSSSVTGNIFSAGPIVGGSNYIYGDIISAGATGLVNGIIATGTVRSHTIQSSSIGKDAYYTTIDAGTIVAGTKYPGSPDTATTSFPITDNQIYNWETDAASGGTVTCSGGKFTINSATTTGAMKVPCNLVIKSADVTVSGPIWVTGNIDFEVGANISMLSTLGSQNVPIIAHNPTATSTSGVISISSGSSFFGSGSAGSFVFVISMNNSAETGGSNTAISINQSSDRLVGYAPHGLITGGQSANLNAATAYKVSLANTSTVTYDTNLPNTLFQAGVTGGYTPTEWGEI